ncbi:MAG: ATP-binding protein [Desulfobacterales bacterium]|nr:ATP-binding protein [Desulfobacterales bacterium]
MERYLNEYIRRDLKEKIVLLSGPRQVGKTTLARQLTSSHAYLNYDAAADRRILQSQEWDRDCELAVFDELHKMKGWKAWIKGIFDTEGTTPQLLVTGSARLDTYKKGGDSLAGRFYSYRLHPLTVHEICTSLEESSQAALDKLMALGGFPEPYLKNSEAFAKRFRRMHTDTIVREDLLDLERVRDIKSIEVMIDLLRSRVGATTSFTALANDLQVSIHTVKHWLQILENLYIIFSVRPYHKNVARSLLKEAKYYLYDTGAVEGGLGPRLENVVACALLRQLHFLEDSTGSKTALHYLRDKEKNEVDFLVLMDNKPVMMVEVKASGDDFSSALFRFQGYLTQARPFQIVYGLTRMRSRGDARMLPAHEFLKDLPGLIPA